MKSIGVFSILVLSIFLSNKGLTQPIVNAGNDTVFCASSWQDAIIGGDPSASGGTSPYTYAWSAAYKYGGKTYSASDMLNDTTIATPAFTSPFHDSAMFYLTVRDLKDSVMIDSILVKFSWYIACLGECKEYIKLGDSVKLGHCVSGGIHPLIFSWSPVASLSDPSSETPWAKPKVNTTYELIIADAIGCQARSICKVYIDPSSIQDQYSIGRYVEIFPNPVEHEITISVNHPEYIGSTLKILSAEGKLVKTICLNQSKVTVMVEDLSPGVYLYQCRSNDGIIVNGKLLIK